MEANQLQEVIEKGFKDLRAELDKRFAQIDGRFEKVDGRFEQIDRQFEQIDGQFEQITGHFEQINGQFEQITGHFEQVAGEFEQIHGQFKTIDRQFVELRGEVTKVGDRAHLAHVAIENLRHDLRIVDEGEPPLEKRVSALEVRVTKLERKPTTKK